MGDQVYAYRSQYDGDNKDCRTVVYDSDGRHRTVYGCPPLDDTTYVETRVTEQRLRPASPPYHHDRRRPQEVDEFLTGIQLEASRTPAPKAHHSARPSHHGLGDYRKGNGYGGGYSSDEYDSGSGSDNDDERRRRHHARPIGTWGSPGSRGGNLGIPTSNINEAVEYLKLGDGSTRPYAGGSETAHHGRGEIPARQYATKYQSTEAVKVKPYGTTTTAHTYGTISNSPTKPYGGTVYAGDSRPLYGSTNKYPTSTAGYASEAVKHHGGGGYGRPINSGGEGRYRDTSVNPHGGYGTTTASSQVIDCYEAAKRFNGKVIRT